MSKKETVVMFFWILLSFVMATPFVILLAKYIEWLARWMK